MRLICPNCDTQYEVADRAIPPGGRDVQCGSCHRSWFQTPALPVAATPEDADHGPAPVEAQDDSSAFASARPSAAPADKVAEAQAAIAAAAANIESMAQSVDGDGPESFDEVAEDAQDFAEDFVERHDTVDDPVLSADTDTAPGTETEPLDDGPPDFNPADALAAISQQMLADTSDDPQETDDAGDLPESETEPETESEPEPEPMNDPVTDQTPEPEPFAAAPNSITEADIEAALEQINHPQDPIEPRPQETAQADDPVADEDDFDGSVTDGVDENLADEIRRLSEELDAESPLHKTRPPSQSGSSAVLGAVSATAASLSDGPLETDSLAARLKQRVADAARSQTGAAGVVGTAPAAGPQVFGASTEAVRQAHDRNDQRTELPDADELSSSLRPKSSIGRGSSLEIEQTEMPPRSGGFSTGFGAALALFVVALGAYYFTPQISRAVPAATPALSAYGEKVDRFRVGVSGFFGRGSASGG